MAAPGRSRNAFMSSLASAARPEAARMRARWKAIVSCPGWSPLTWAPASSTSSMPLEEGSPLARAMTSQGRLRVRVHRPKAAA